MPTRASGTTMMPIKSTLRKSGFMSLPPFFDLQKILRGSKKFPYLLLVKNPLRLPLLYFTTSFSKHITLAIRRVNTGKTVFHQTKCCIFLKKTVGTNWSCLLICICNVVSLYKNVKITFQEVILILPKTRRSKS